MKECQFPKTIININKRDSFFLALYFIIYILISQHGILKYVALSGAIVLTLLITTKINLKYFVVMIHALFYTAYGALLSYVNMMFSFDSVKQILIYICPGLFSIFFFSIYGKKNSKKMLDVQFVGLCLAYICLFARKINYSSLSFESHMYAYIFGAFAIIYFWQKRYRWMLSALLFMFIEDKRIVFLAFGVTLFFSFIIGKIRNERYLGIINKWLSFLLLICPIIWIYLCSSGVLELIFQLLEINSMGRLNGSSAWSQAGQYYDFSPVYLGRGIGWVLGWLGRAGISSFPILHNDFLAGYIELGFWGYVMWIILFLTIPCLLRKNVHIANAVILLTGYMFINFLTDNTYIYVTWLLPFYSILLAIVYGKDGVLPYGKNDYTDEQ